MVGLGFIDGLRGGLQIRPRLQSDTAKILQRQDAFGELERPRDVELLDGRPVVHQRQKLDLGGSQVGFGGLDIGFELDALQFQAV